MDDKHLSEGLFNGDGQHAADLEERQISSLISSVLALRKDMSLKTSLVSMTPRKPNANDKTLMVANTNSDKSEIPAKSTTRKAMKQTPESLYPSSTDFLLDSLKDVNAILWPALSLTCTFQHSKTKQATLSSSHLHKQNVIPRILARVPRLVSKIFEQEKSLGCMLFLTLIGAVSAMDNEIALQTYPANVIAPNPVNRIQLGLAGTYIVMIVGVVSTATTNLLGPLMGISSVLWFIMRNDAAIQPRISWAIFGIWSSVTLVYLSYQTRKVVMGKLYILLALAFAGLCLCIVAMVQKSSIQGGLVTAIPPCTSFAAYAVAFCFPKQRHTGQETMV